MPNEQTSVPLFTSGEVLTAANMNLSAGTGIPVFATTVTRDAAFGGAGEKVLAEGQLCYLSDSNIVQYYTGAAWATLAPSTSITTAIFNESQASGTSGGGSVSGSFIKRTLNTTIINEISGCSLASSVITLPAGTYKVMASAPFLTGVANKLKLRNTSDSTDAILSQNGYLNAGGGGASTPLNGTFTIATSKNFELQYRVGTTVASFGLGEAGSFGVSEVYSVIQIEKIA